MREIKEVKDDIKHYKNLLKSPDCNLETQTWIELQLKELRKELKLIKNV
jgi:hypothetical protein